MKRNLIWLAAGAVAGFLLCWYFLGCGKSSLPPSRKADKDTVDRLKVEIGDRSLVVKDSIGVWRRSFDSLSQVKDSIDARKQATNDQLAAARITIKELIAEVHGDDTTLKAISCDSLAAQFDRYITLSGADSLWTAQILNSLLERIQILRKEVNFREDFGDSLRSAFDKVVSKYDSLAKDYVVVRNLEKARAQLYLSLAAQYCTDYTAAGGGLMLRDKRGKCYEGDVLFTASKGRIYQLSFKLPITLKKK